MKKIITTIAICMNLCMQAQSNFSNEDDNEKVEPKQLVVFLPAMGAAFMHTNTNMVAQQFQTHQYNATFANPTCGYFDLQSYYGKHWRPSLTFFVGNGDTLKNLNTDFVSKNNWTRVSIGYSLRQNAVIEKFNLIPYAGLFSNSNCVAVNDVSYNPGSRGLTYKELTNWRWTKIGYTAGIKAQTQLSTQSMFGILVLGVDAGFMQSFNAKSKIVEKDNGEKFIFQQKNSVDYFGSVFCKFNIPIFISNSRGQAKTKKTKILL
jgi:hypothetical protein